MELIGAVMMAVAESFTTLLIGLWACGHFNLPYHVFTGVCFHAALPYTSASSLHAAQRRCEEAIVHKTGCKRLYS